MFRSHIYAPKNPHLFYPSFTCVTLSGPPTPLKICYLACNLKEVARAWVKHIFKTQNCDRLYCQLAPSSPICGCNNNTIFIKKSSFKVSYRRCMPCTLAWRRAGLGHACQSGNMLCGDIVDLIGFCVQNVVSV